MNPLDNLKDIQTPADIGNWPPAYGWWIVALVTLIILYAVIKFIYRFKQQRKAKKQALTEVASIMLEDKNAAIQLNQILKRVAQDYFPSIYVQKLHGEQWIQFLASALPNKQADKNTEHLTRFQNNLYQNKELTDDELNQYKKIVEQWIKLATPPSSKTTQTLEQDHARV